MNQKFTSSYLFDFEQVIWDSISTGDSKSILLGLLEAEIK